MFVPPPHQWLWTCNWRNLRLQLLTFTNINQCWDHLDQHPSQYPFCSQHTCPACISSQWTSLTSVETCFSLSHQNTRILPYLQWLNKGFFIHQLCRCRLGQQSKLLLLNLWIHFLQSGCLISWAAKKQPSISLSSTESEYMAMTLATCEAVFLWQFLIELSFHPPSPIPICINNQLAIARACNLEFHVHTKHIEVHHHYICKKLKDEVIDHQYISLLRATLFTMSL